MKYIFIIILFFSFYSFAKEVEKKEYIVGVENYARYPFQSVINNNYHGVFKQILDKFASDYGIKFKYKPYKIKDLYSNFYINNLDFKFPDNPVWRSTQKNKFNIIYSDFITHYIDGIFVRSDDLSKNLNELKIVGSVDDIIQWTLISKEKKGKIEVRRYQSCSEMIDLLVKKEINAIYCNYDVMKYLLKESTINDNIIINLDLPFIDNYFHISTIMHPQIIKKLNIWISNNRNYIDKKIHEYK